VAYKIAARWHDDLGDVELKGYGQSCFAHLGSLFRAAQVRRGACEGMPGEVIEEVGIYRWEPGFRDRHHERLHGLEAGYDDPGGSGVWSAIGVTRLRKPDDSSPRLTVV
jgi:hypothetical protein